MRFKLYQYVAVFLFLLSSCSTTKYVDDGDYLLDKVEVKKDRKYPDINLAQYKSYVRQKGNSRWFSAFKIPLYTYSLSGRDSSLWLNRTLKAMGEAPVVYDSVKTSQSCADLRAAMANNGYLGAHVEVKERRKGKKMVVTYTLHPGAPYYLGRVDYEVQDSALAGLLCLDDTLNRGLYPGMRFSVDNLDQERKRVTERLLNDGYYKFHKDYITYRADTIAGRKDIALTFVLHRFRVDNETITDHPQYHVRSVSYLSGDPKDSVIHLRRSVLYSNTFITPGSVYASRDLQNTYNRFARLQAVKYTNVGFVEVPDSQLLDCNVMLSTNKPSTISFQPEGTNTAGDLGAAASLTYQHRNLFRGSELLSVELRGAYEAIRGLEGYGNEDFLEYSFETKLSFPRFITPLASPGFLRRTNASSEVSLLYDLQNRPEYHRRVLSLAWRYKWHDVNHHDKYQVDLLDLNYVFMPWISETFRHEYLDNVDSRNAILRYNYEDLFIMKFGFGYVYNKGNYAIKANVETAGNVLGLASSVFHFSKNDQGQRKLFNIAYAQFVKCDFEYTRNVKLDYDNTLVFHIALGLAYPYGNSTILPFEKRYFSGGANSVRGWSVRELGPGRFARRDGRIDFINQTGDMKLDMNVEYRAHIFWKLNGAVFVDAGNIWTLRDYADQPGGKFQFDTFVQQLAVSYGLGFRLNFDFFVLRFDFGMKAVNPMYAEEGSLHYPIVNPRLSRDLAFHFAVGLPF